MTHCPTPETRAQVSALKSYGHTQAEIAKFLEIAIDTLTYYYFKELENAELIANAEVARHLYKRATKKDDLSAQIFWLKTRAKWRTEDVVNIIDQNAALKKELLELQAALDVKNKKEY